MDLLDVFVRAGQTASCQGDLRLLHSVVAIAVDILVDIIEVIVVVVVVDIVLVFTLIFFHAEEKRWYAVTGPHKIIRCCIMMRIHSHICLFPFFSLLIFTSKPFSRNFACKKALRWPSMFLTLAVNLGEEEFKKKHLVYFLF